MKFTLVTAILVTATGVAAKSCKNGGVYCGQSLLNRGDYQDDIERVLKLLDKDTSDVNVKNSLFNCVEHGNIEYVSFCDKGCSGVGNDDDDACL